MSLQTVLLRVLSSRILQGSGQRMLRRRTWRVEGGEAAGLRMVLPQNRDYVLGTSELPVQQALHAHLQPGDVFYDVGANVGFFSLMAARRIGPAGFVCSFEPVSENAATVRQNAALNDLDNIRVVEVAAGSASGVAEFLLTEWDGGGTLAASAVRATEPTSRRQVPVVAIDDMVANGQLPRPSFVKIDVEGVEKEVLEGMSRTIQECMPILLYEVDDGDRKSFERRWRALDDYVTALDYRVTRLRDSYSNANWQVGHSLALPRGMRGLDSA